MAQNIFKAKVLNDQTKATLKGATAYQIADFIDYNALEIIFLLMELLLI